MELEGVTVSPPRSHLMADWQVDGLARARVTEYYQGISTTLNVNL